MINREMKWPEVAPQSTADEFEQEFERMTVAPKKGIPEAFFDSAESLLAIHDELLDKEQIAE